VQNIRRFAGVPSPAQIKALGLGVHAPLANGSVIHGGAHAEFESVSQRGAIRGRTVRAIGHQLLDAVTTTVSRREGQRIQSYMISPQALGGRLAVLGTTFEQHKANACQFRYSTSVAATEPGAMLMYLRNDIMTPMLDTGADEVRHASTHDDFMQFPVWQDAAMACKPENMLQRYDSDIGTAPQLNIQAILQVEAASDLTGATNYGNIYVHYDFEFFSEALDYEEGAVYDPVVQLEFNAFVMSALSGQALVLPFNNVTAAGNARFSFVGAGLPSVQYILLGTIESAIFTAGPGTLQFYTNRDARPKTFATGQSLYMAFTTDRDSSNFTNDTIYGVLFTAPPDGTDADVVHIFNTAAGATTGIIRLSSNAIPTTE